MKNFNRVGFQKYLIDSIDADYLFECGYETGDARENLIAMYENFKSEMGYTIERVGEPIAFKDWLAGLCGASNIHFMNHDIKEILIRYGAITKETTTRKQDDYVMNWFQFCANAYLKLIKRAVKGNKINY